MPMIDVYAAEGTFNDKHALAKDLASAVMKWEKVPDLAMFRNNTAAFIHELNQAEQSGSWPAESMNKPHQAGTMPALFMSDAATGYATLALLGQ